MVLPLVIQVSPANHQNYDADPIIRGYAQADKRVVVCKNLSPIYETDRKKGMEVKLSHQHFFNFVNPVYWVDDQRSDRYVRAHMMAVIR